MSQHKIPIRPGFIRGSELAKEFGMDSRSVCIYLRYAEKYEHRGKHRECCYEAVQARKALQAQRDFMNGLIERPGRPARPPKIFTLPPVDVFRQVAAEFRAEQNRFWG